MRLFRGPGCSGKLKGGSSEVVASRAAVTDGDQGAAPDPALLAALLESLKMQRGEDSGAAGRFLCRNLSEAEPTVAGRLRQHRAAQLHVSPDGISYFDHCTEDHQRLTLPSFQGYPPEVRQQVLGQLCNDWLQREAEAAGVINCIPGCTPQLVLNTQGDGNCLAHACSLGIWGVHDRDQAIRGAIRATMTHPLAGAEIRLRFERQLRQNGIPQEEWVAEWKRELSAFHNSSRMSDRYLSDVHCFALANVLRRPLVLYGDEHAALAGLTGIYLPLLWPPGACSPEPVGMLFWGSHFSVLCVVQGEGPASPQLLPLCTRDGPLQVRFLSASEEGKYGSQGKALELLQQYMACEQLPSAAAVWRHKTPVGGDKWQAEAARLQEQHQRNQRQHQQQGGLEGRDGNGTDAISPCDDGRTRAARTADMALGVRLAADPAPQSLLHLMEAAFVQQTAALCSSGRCSGTGRRRSSVGCAAGA
ncbi:hypothetical protein N2152v2_010062 [Parachlorella kessleri]